MGNVPTPLRPEEVAQILRRMEAPGGVLLTHALAIQPGTAPGCSCSKPVITAMTAAGRTRQIAWAEEDVQLKDYGTARQITLFEHGSVALQILTSDTDACPAEILAWLKSRWREENFLKYASENYGIDKICDYLAIIETNTKIVDNPARKAAKVAPLAAILVSGSFIIETMLP